MCGRRTERKSDDDQNDDENRVNRAHDDLQSRDRQQERRRRWRRARIDGRWAEGKFAASSTVVQSAHEEPMSCHRRDGLRKIKANIHFFRADEWKSLNPPCTSMTAAAVNFWRSAPAFVPGVVHPETCTWNVHLGKLDLATCT
jgi:hypothetical protein